METGLVENEKVGPYAFSIRDLWGASRIQVVSTEGYELINS